MNWKGLYIILLFVVFGFSLNVCRAADSIFCDNGTYSIVFNCVPTLNGIALHDGDKINVTSNIPEDAWESNSVDYLRDSLNTISLPETLAIDSSHVSSRLEFSVQSKAGNCISNNIEFITDEMNSSECALSISSFTAEYHSIEYPSEIICTGDSPVTIFSDIPDNNFIISSHSKGLRISDKGEIIPRESIPGYHVVNITSDYCLSSDSLLIEIISSPDLALADTLPICRGSSISTAAPDNSDIYFYDSENSDAYIEGEITESGSYIAVSNQGPCASIDTVFVDLIDQPEIHWDLQEDCDRVIVNTNIPASENYEVSWSNDIRGPENIVYKDTLLTVDIRDDSGCITRDSIAIVVKRLALKSVDYQKEEADCWTDGQMIIDAGEVDNYKGNYHYRLYNKLTNQLFTNLNEVPEGVYTLQVVDDRDCVADYDKTVKVEQKCLEDYPAFSPNGDNIEDNYFIPHEGHVSIYNREGVLLKEIETPAYWDGTDSQNNLLPMGNYLLVTESGRPVNITIIR